MKFIIIGSGSIGKRHISNISYLINDVKFILVKHRGNDDYFSKSIGAKVVPTVEDAISLGGEIAVIATPTAYHMDSIIPLLKNDISFYIEKPLVYSKQQLEALVDILNNIKIVPKTVVGCNLRFLTSMQIVKKYIDEGRIGEVVSAHLYAGQWLPDWRPGTDYKTGYSACQKLGGGVILDLIHEIDIANWLLGPFDDLTGMSLNASVLEIETESVASIILKNKACLCTIMLDYISRRPFREYRFIGTKGSIVYDLIKKKSVFYDSKVDSIIDDHPSHFDVNQTYKDAMNELIDQNIHPRYDIEQAIDSMRLAINIKESLCQ